MNTRFTVRTPPYYRVRNIVSDAPHRPYMRYYILLPLNTTAPDIFLCIEIIISHNDGHRPRLIRHTHYNNNYNNILYVYTVIRHSALHLHNGRRRHSMRIYNASVVYILQLYIQAHQLLYRTQRCHVHAGHSSLGGCVCSGGIICKSFGI